ncbi:MAG: hypothetical protein WBW34_09555 [Nitrososphaeraceae archaeon]
MEVADLLNLPGLQVQKFYLEYWKLKRMYKLATLFEENEDRIGYLIELGRLGREERLTPKQIVNFIGMADNISNFKAELQHLQLEVAGLELKKSVRTRELKKLKDEIKRTIYKFFRVDAEF